MANDPMSDPIVSARTNLGAPTGEGRIYTTRSGREWRSGPNGGVVSGAHTGELISGGKFGPTGVRVFT